MKTQGIINHIVNWLTTYVESSELNGFVIGVSGGIDSAVTSCLCAKTGKPVIAMNMPIYQAKDQVSRSCDHIDWLKKKFDNVTGVDVELSFVFDGIKKCFPTDIQDDLTMANTRSRLRMLTLYAYASHHKMLVAGTGNKVEDFGVGFYTKYGDGGVDLSPIADLMKTQVYALGRDLSIIEPILKAAPTDGLWEDERTDESQIGATYAELEWAMDYLAANADSRPHGRLPVSLPVNERQKQVLTIYNGFHKANKHKMEPIPVCIIPDRLKT
ncbi:MAG: NAD(+) synthase [Desulfobacula sp.]|nr:NAD(+) synthase [Desulfobacula sp.]